jgi:hypothetical protein
MEGPRLVTSPATGGDKVGSASAPTLLPGVRRPGRILLPASRRRAGRAGGFTGTYVVYSRHTQSSGSSS